MVPFDILSFQSVSFVNWAQPFSIEDKKFVVTTELGVFDYVAIKVSESDIDTLSTSSTSVKELCFEHVVEQKGFTYTLLADLGHNEKIDVLAASLFWDVLTHKWN